MLALNTGIPPSAWLAEGDRAIATAFELLDEASRKHQHGSGDGPQMSG